VQVLGKGAFELTDGGTIFLDEIGECDLETQARLLRVLQPLPGEGPAIRTIRRLSADEGDIVNAPSKSHDVPFIHLPFIRLPPYLTINVFNP
jgi:transcriptional regulator with AAA-type ATPase domain